MCAAAAALTSWVIITLKWLVRQTCRDKTYIAYIVILFVESCLIATVVTSWTCFFFIGLLGPTDMPSKLCLPLVGLDANARTLNCRRSHLVCEGLRMVLCY